MERNNCSHYQSNPRRNDYVTIKALTLPTVITKHIPSINSSKKNNPQGNCPWGQLIAVGKRPSRLILTRVFAVTCCRSSSNSKDVIVVIVVIWVMSQKRIETAGNGRPAFGRPECPISPSEFSFLVEVFVFGISTSVESFFESSQKKDIRTIDF